MKKLLLSLVLGLGTLVATYGQGYYMISSTGTTGAYSSLDTSGPIIMPAGSNDILSAAQTLPFSWSFYGTAVTSYKLSDNGYITFDPTATTSVAANIALPNASAPKNAIFAFWDDMEFKTIPSSAVRAQARAYTYGSAPNRVHVIQWFTASKVGTAAGSANYFYFAIRLYEGGSFDIVYDDASPSLTGLSGTIGCQNATGTKGTNLDGSPNADVPNKLGSQTNATNKVYNFTYGPDNNIMVRTINLPKYLQKNTDVSITGRVYNLGTSSLSSFKLNYSINGGAARTMQLTGLNIDPNGAGYYDFTHNQPFNSSTAQNAVIRVWTSNPNGVADGDTTNDSQTGTIAVVASTVPRKVLHEVFCASTGNASAAGNTNLLGILNANQGKWNVIKYPMCISPDLGDPYYTAEHGTRFAYYGGTGTPLMRVDGSSFATATINSTNPNSYVQASIDAASAIPALASITASHTRSGTTFTVSGTVTPVQAFTNNKMRIRISLVERVTHNNAKTNGETEFYNINKKMLPDANGIALDLSTGNPVSFTQSYTFKGNYRLPDDGTAANIINLATEHSVEQFGNISAIVFVQDDADSSVWNSAATATVWALGMNEIQDIGLKVYPNPASTNFAVEFNENAHEGLVRILDLSGKEVLNQMINRSNNTIYCDNLQNGLYVVELTVDGKTAVRKLNIAK